RYRHAFRYEVGTPGDHRNADRFFVGVTFVDEPVFSEGEAVIAHVDDERVFTQPVLVDEVEHPADAFVQRESGLGVTAIKRIEVELAVVGVVNSVPAVALLPYPSRLS